MYLRKRGLNTQDGECEGNYHLNYFGSAIATTAREAQVDFELIGHDSLNSSLLRWRQLGDAAKGYCLQGLGSRFGILPHELLRRLVDDRAVGLHREEPVNAEQQ
jgi:hypothetical protein